jgi:hypothetical protein
VARSAEPHARGRVLITVAVALAAAAAVAGCSTTQQEAARLQLNSARIRASQLPTRVTAPGQAVRVTQVARIVTGGRTAFVVRVLNPGAKPVSDLPISVGVRVGGKRPVYVNTQSPEEFSYFDAHLPLVPAGGTVTWVYTTTRRLPSRARPFAVVGGAPSARARWTTPLPVIRAHAVPAGGAANVAAGAGALTVVVRNLSTVPQYQLQVYAFARRGGRYVAAGDFTVTHLGSRATRTLRLGVLGPLDHARLQLEAPPTIFQ